MVYMDKDVSEFMEVQMWQQLGTKRESSWRSPVSTAAPLVVSNGKTMESGMHTFPLGAQ